jgi:translocation and assembly module TamB
MPRPRKRARARTALGVIGAAVGTSVTFVVGVAAGAVLHLDVPATRRLVATRVTALLRDQLAGDVAIERIDGLGLRGVSGVRGRVKDPEGVQVLYVDGARVRLHALAVARSFLFEKGDIAIAVDEASVARVDASIDTDPAGNMRLARAFAARTPSPPTPGEPSARGVRVEAPSVRLGHASVHRQSEGAAPMQADLDDLVARAHYDPTSTRAALVQVDVRARGLPRAVDPTGRLTAHLAMPSRTGTSLGVDATFDGKVAGIPTAVHAGIDGKKVDAVVDGRDATGQGMRAAFGEVGIREDVTLHAEVHGELPKVSAKANLRVGRGTADLTADLDLRDGTDVAARVSVRHADLRAILPSAPSSDLALDAQARVVVAKSGAVSAAGAGTLVDPRGTADFEVRSRTVGGDAILEGRLDVAVPELARLPAPGGTAMRGLVLASARGSTSLGKKTFDATVEVTGAGLAYGAQTVDELHVVASSRGTTARPVIDVETRIDLVKEGIAVSASADHVQIAGSRVRVDGAVITGLGEPIHADASREANVLRIAIAAPGIDLQRVATLAGRASTVRSGRLSLNADVAVARGTATGELHAKVDSLSAAKFEGASLTLDGAFDGRHLGLDLDAEIPDTGTVRLVTKGITLDGSPLDVASWRRAHGRARFEGSVDMAKVVTLVPEALVPFSELRGTGVIAGTVRRDSADVPPEASVHLHTRGLVVSGKGRGEPLHDVQHQERVSGVQPWRSEGVDVSFDARVDGTSGAGEVALQLADAKGTVAAFDVKADLPYREALADPARARELLVRAPISVKAVVPKRALAEMPSLGGLRTLAGTVEAELSVAGTLLEPRAELVAHSRGVRPPRLAEKLASDVDVTFRYDGVEGDLVATASDGTHRMLDLSAHVDVRSRDLLEGEAGEPLAWTGSAKVKLGSFPLESIGPLADLRIRGMITGEASVDDLHHDARLRAQIALERLKIGRGVFDRGSVVLDVQGGKAVAHARLEQVDGYADVQATTGLPWGASLAPTVDPNASVDAHLVAKSFRAAAILPFVRSVFNELDGRIDADATVKVGGDRGAAALAGKIVFRDATLQLATFGDELRDARATVTFQPGGAVAVDDVFTRSSSGGEVTAKGAVTMRGLMFSSATASAHIPERKALDVSLQGQPIGAVVGDVFASATASEDGKQIAVQVDVPAAHLTLAQRTKSGVQELGEKEAIRVGTFRDARTFVRLPLDKEDLTPPSTTPPEPGTVVDADLRLGDITITQGNQVRVVLGGNPHLRLAGTTELSGQIRAKQGTVDVQGKKFEIDKGTITFQPGDTSNPIVVATASWTAEDGTKVYADFVGPVKTGKVNLRSDPPRPKNEILAIILFGTANGANAAPPPPGRAPNGTTQAATALGGGFAAQGLTEAMDDLTGLQATARIDTTRSANPAPEIEIQIARRLSIAFEHILGTPPLSEPDTNLAIVDWRFRNNWSLELTVGDRGKVQTDAVWTRTY